MVGLVGARDLQKRGLGCCSPEQVRESWGNNILTINLTTSQLAASAHNSSEPFRYGLVEAKHPVYEVMRALIAGIEDGKPVSSAGKARFRGASLVMMPIFLYTSPIAI